MFFICSKYGNLLPRFLTELGLKRRKLDSAPPPFILRHGDSREQVQIIQVYASGRGVFQEFVQGGAQHPIGPKTP